MPVYECFNEEYAKIIDPTDIDASIIKQFDNIDAAVEWFESELDKHDIETIGYVDEVFPLEEFTDIISNEYPMVTVNDIIGEFGCITVAFNHHSLRPSDQISYIKDKVYSIFSGDVSVSIDRNGSVVIDLELESETINEE